MKFRGFSLRSTPSSATSRGPPRGGGYGTLRFHLEPQIQNSKFKIQNYCSGRSLRRSRTTARSCGPPPPPGCGPPIPAGSNLTASPQPSGRACDAKEQPSARGGCGLPVLMDRNLPRNTLPMTGLLRLLAKSLIKNSKRKIKRCCCTNTNSFSGRSLRRDGTSGCELRASARRRPATPWRRRRALRRLRPEPESSFALFQHNGPQHRKYAFHGPQPVKSSS